MERLRLSSIIPPTALLACASVFAQEPAVELEPVTVYSSLVANQESVGTFAMPVTALRYEPLVDVQARNMAEGQADVSIRGGTFENTGFNIGAVPIYDPQTGHYFAELPVAPAMLGAPEVRTGVENSLMGWNATAGSVGYMWTPVRSNGFVSVGAGDNSLLRGEVYAGYVADKTLLGRTVGADVDIAASQGDGTRSFGDHDFARYNARFQLRDEATQTDVFAGYQSKFFGWHSMYAAPFSDLFNANETENLQTTLYSINHRVAYDADGDYFQLGAYHRRNVDDYEFSRLPPADTFWHETKVTGAGFDGRASFTDTTALRYRAGAVADKIDSLALTFGPFESRTQVYSGLFVDHVVTLDDIRDVVFTAGANYDDSNRDGSAVSPVAEIAFVKSAGAMRRAYVSYAESTQLPTYTALSSNPAGGLFGGNADLGRSDARNYELGSEWVSGAWSTHAAVFYRQDEDLVDWVFGGVVPPPPVRRAVAGDIDTVGFELVTRREWRFIDLVLGYTWLDKNEDYLAPGESSFYAFNYAEHRLTAAIVARLGGGFELRMDNEIRFQEENALRTRNDDVILSALGLYYAVPRVKGLTLSAQVDNLWNTYYEEVPLVPGSRREWSVGARYAW